MNCKNCGHGIPFNSIACPSCGVMLSKSDIEKLRKQKTILPSNNFNIDDKVVYNHKKTINEYYKVYLILFVSVLIIIILVVLKALGD
jgi:uncharacterized membrane protein YvbJ